MQKRSSKATLVSVTGRLSKLSSYAAFKDYTHSEAFTHSLLAMNHADRLVALNALQDATKRCDAMLAPLKPPGTARVYRWDAAWKAKLRAAYKKFPDDDKAVARALEIPLGAARLARYKFIGRRDEPRPRRSRGVAATPTPRPETPGMAAG